MTNTLKTETAKLLIKIWIGIFLIALVIDIANCLN